MLIKKGDLVRRKTIQSHCLGDTHPSDWHDTCLVIRGPYEASFPAAPGESKRLIVTRAIDVLYGEEIRLKCPVADFERIKL